MATSTLEQIVNSIIDPVEPSEQATMIIDGNQLNITRVSEMLRDVPLHTTGDVMLWVLSAHSIDNNVNATYSFVVHDGSFYLRDLSLWDINSISIDGICTSFTVNFVGMNIMSVMFDDQKIICDTMEFHKGDFILSSNGKDVGIVSGVW